MKYNNFNDLIEGWVVHTARECMRRDGCHVPMVISFTSNGSPNFHPLTELLNNADEMEQYGDEAYHSAKDMIATYIKKSLMKDKAIAYVHIAECWFLAQKKDKPLKTYNIRKLPEKEEALSIAWEYKHNGVHRSGCYFMPFKRSKGDIVFKKTISIDGSKTGGRFVNLLS